MGKGDRASQARCHGGDTASPRRTSAPEFSQLGQEARALTHPVPSIDGGGLLWGIGRGVFSCPLTLSSSRQSMFLGLRESRGKGMKEVAFTKVNMGETLTGPRTGSTSPDQRCRKEA